MFEKPVPHFRLNSLGFNQNYSFTSLFISSIIWFHLDFLPLLHLWVLHSRYFTNSMAISVVEASGIIIAQSESERGTV